METSYHSFCLGGIGSMFPWMYCNLFDFGPSLGYVRPFKLLQVGLDLGLC